MIRKLIPLLGRIAGSADAGMRTQQTGERKSVLLIDDRAESLHALEAALADRGLRVEAADTAEAALGKLAGSTPDMILLNPEVRAVNGARLARRLLADERLAAVPIAALRNGTDAPAGAGEGDDRYDAELTTAASPQWLWSKVRAVLESCRVPASRRPLERPLPEAAAAGGMKQADRLLRSIEQQLPDSQFDASAQEGLRRLAEAVEAEGELAHHLEDAARFADAATARARWQFRSLVRYCRDLAQREDPVPGLQELRVSYVEHRREEMDGLDRALNAGDYGSLRKSGHNLKGMGAAYGFSELTELGRTLESAARDFNGPLVEATLDRIEAYLKLVEPSAEARGENAAGN